MKKSYILSPVVIAAGAFLWMSASGGVADDQSKDRTGSPVSDQACTACHSGGSFSASASVVVKDMSGALVTEYTPGETYGVTVEIQSTGNSGHGFQLTALLVNNSSAGTCSATSSNTKSTALNGKWYFEHSSMVTGGSYEMTWVAPAIGSGDVTFYGSSLSVDGNGQTGGDQYANIPDVVITEATPNGIASVTVESALQVFPNPVASELNISLGTETINRVEVYAISGRLVYQEINNTSKVMLDVSGYYSGTYFVRVFGENGSKTTSFVKQ